MKSVPESNHETQIDNSSPIPPHLLKDVETPETYWVDIWTEINEILAVHPNEDITPEDNTSEDEDNMMNIITLYSESFSENDDSEETLDEFVEGEYDFYPLFPNHVPRNFNIETDMEYNK